MSLSIESARFARAAASAAVATSGTAFGQFTSKSQTMSAI
jgi:hypothetical protein